MPGSSALLQYWELDDHSWFISQSLAALLHLEEGLLTDFLLSNNFLQPRTGPNLEMKATASHAMSGGFQRETASASTFRRLEAVLDMLC